MNKLQLLQKQFSISKKSVLSLIAFIFIFFVTRVPFLWYDTINPDGVNWHYRTQQFVNGLKYAQFEKTYQHYHPGITMMWITGVSTEVYKQITNIKDYSIYNFIAFDFISKLSLVVVQLILTLYLIFLLKKYFDRWGAILLAGMFTFEPFFVGNSRLYHMDILFTLLLFAALLTGYLAYERKSYYYYSWTGVLLALTILTKSIGILAVVFYLVWFIAKSILDKDPNNIKRILVVVLTFGITCFALFPALWVKPIYYINEIFSESERVGLRRGHSQIIFGTPTDEASPWFYLIAIILKTSPFMLLGMFLSIFYVYKLEKRFLQQVDRGFIWYFITFALIYLIVMSTASKKIDRYILPLYPFMALISYYGYLSLNKVKNFYIFQGILIASFIVLPLFKLYPYYFTYTNPLLGSPDEANQIIGQKPFGIGVYELRDFIVKKHGDVNLGFIDTKPMESIYPNSKVFDIRANGLGDYDLVVLGINESLDGTEIEQPQKLILSDSVYINGLEYWRIFRKSE